MQQSSAQRRLVKSPPELWAEVSSEESLGRHLAPFGEIRITRVDPESTVAWEGDRASGTVELEPAGWGTKVVLTATPAGGGEARGAGPRAATQPPPGQHDRDLEPLRTGFLARLFRRGGSVQTAPGPDPTPPGPVPAPTPPAAAAADDGRTAAILSDVLDDLGAAHHRPFSRD